MEVFRTVTVRGCLEAGSKASFVTEGSEGVRLEGELRTLRLEGIRLEGELRNTEGWMDSRSKTSFVH